MPTGEPLPTIRTTSAALALFLVLVLGLSWLRFIPPMIEQATGAALPPAIVDVLLPILASFAPLWAALLVSSRRLGGEGVRSLLGQIFRWRTGLDWYALALAGPILLFGLALGAAWLTGSSLPWFGPEELVGAAGIFVAGLVFVAGEEYGWRGYLQPALQARWPPLGAALLVGAIWAGWHAPLFFDLDAVQVGVPPLAFLALGIGLSMILAWVYNSSAGSLLIVVLAHAATNASLGAIALNLPDSESVGRYVILSAAAVEEGAVVGADRPLRPAHNPRAGNGLQAVKEFFGAAGPVDVDVTQSSPRASSSPSTRTTRPGTWPASTSSDSRRVGWASPASRGIARAAQAA